MTTLFLQITEIHWLAATYFRYQDVYQLEKEIHTFEDWFAARKGHDKYALAYLMKISRTRIKVG